jgi:hypothetical protein
MPFDDKVLNELLIEWWRFLRRGRRSRWQRRRLRLTIFLKSKKGSSSAHGHDRQEPFPSNDFVHPTSANVT